MTVNGQDKTQGGRYGREDFHKDDQPQVPIGTKVEMTVTAEILTGDHSQVTRTFIVPFARSNREDDYPNA